MPERSRRRRRPSKRLCSTPWRPDTHRICFRHRSKGYRSHRHPGTPTRPTVSGRFRLLLRLGQVCNIGAPPPYLYCTDTDTACMHHLFFLLATLLACCTVISGMLLFCILVDTSQPTPFVLLWRGWHVSHYHHKELKEFCKAGPTASPAQLPPVRSTTRPPTTTLDKPSTLLTRAKTEPCRRRVVAMSSPCRRRVSTAGQ
ncbi:hypothetical protein CC85DRAFT_167209 [Cutaneotrichosporon oleaginosum]|uniref:Uncharacterized protein n=1 Tax=Cutaneotrichosporon oleaginosum TaxID=879819 RepID=A0A0J0XFS5_9TREE|nr:uncharacterized protein CC85DRAFT_167209 [Cutaneotrichosporon oleaginosum]KLT39911.1 hypothetical protein CC85DRAFT_167209 [Cutaneotrichosporon oleaginosum]TXT08325.1 hypothetical protein COLE_05249 [Cutaneotrichosporon oleaginosum]